MKYFNQNSQRSIKLGVRQDRIRDIKRGYPWVFSHSLITHPKANAGSFALLKDKENKIIASGFYEPESQLSFRVCSLDEPLNDVVIEQRIDQAFQLRKSVLSEQTTCARLLNGEGDLLPGVICDLYGERAVMQLDGEGAENFWNIEAIAAYIAQALKIKHIALKPRAGDKRTGRTLFGELSEECARFLEHDAVFEADLVHGQKSGFFLDQRENRLLVRQIAKGKNVLNLFGYTGGFSVAAGLGGAVSVDTVDISKPAINAAAINWRLNKLSEETHRGYAENAFDFLDRCKSEKHSYDLVIVDPPSFVSSQAAMEKGRSAYISLFASAAQATNRNGMLALASCSSHLSSELFLEICVEAVSKAKRRARIAAVNGQPLDHPFPLVCRELQYLKFALLKLN